MKLFHVLVGVLIASFPLSASAYVTLTGDSEPLRVDGTLDDNAYIVGDAVDVVSPVMGDVFFA